jgi:hemin uptake protein HemP
MQGHREIVIRHGNEAYRLSVTRSGKLILRK